MTAKKKPDPSAEEIAAKELVRQAKEQGLSLTGPDGLLKQFTKSVLETALNEEMTEHVGHEKNRAPDGRESTNIRNGTRPKTVLTHATGDVEIEVPRDRDGTFDPVIVRKRQRRAVRGRRDRPVAVCPGFDDRGDRGALRPDLRGVGVEGDGLPDHRQGRRGDADLGEPAVGAGVRGDRHCCIERSDDHAAADLPVDRLRQALKRPSPSRKRRRSGALGGWPPPGPKNLRHREHEIAQRNTALMSDADRQLRAWHPRAELEIVARNPPVCAVRPRL